MPPRRVSHQNGTRNLNALARSWEGELPGEPLRNPARTEPRPSGITQGCVEYGPKATKLFARSNRLLLLTGEVVLIGVLLGAAALIFVSAPTDSPALSSPPLVAKFPAGLVEAIAFSPDGKTLASAGDDHSLRLWTMANVRGVGPFQPTITEPPTGGLALAFSPDGQTLVMGCERLLMIWSYEAERCTSPRELACDTVRCLTFSPDGRTLALGCDDGSVRLWDMPAVRERALLEAHVDAVRSVSFCSGRTATWCPPVRIGSSCSGTQN